MSSTTFDVLTKLLNALIDFTEEDGKTDLVKSVLKILSAHFSLFSNAPAHNDMSVSSEDKKKLETLLFGLVDSPNCPQVSLFHVLCANLNRQIIYRR